MLFRPTEVNKHSSRGEGLTILPHASFISEKSS